MAKESKTSQAGELSLDAFERLVRAHPEEFASLHDELCDSVTLEGTRATVRCRYILNDGNNRPRINDLARLVAAEMIDYAIPRSEIELAREKDRADGSTRCFAELHRKARSLFSELERTGEGGEMLLYILTESLLKIPQVLCKMPLKTSGQMHYHGCDGIHATVGEGGTLALYWGESKLHASVSSAMSECFDSIAPFLLDAGGSDAAQQRDIELLMGHIDLNDDALESALLEYLNPRSQRFRQLEYRGVCLVGFDCEDYPTHPDQKVLEEIKKGLLARAQGWRRSFSGYIERGQLATFVIEIFCLPFPSVESFRKAFLKELTLS